jgi:hypothetical protein
LIKLLVMKSYLLAQLIVLLPFLSFTQDDLVIKGTKKVSQELTPQQVIDSLHKHFPDAEAVKYYKGTAEVTQRGWSVSTEDNLTPGASVDYYTISFKQEGLQYYGLYQGDGTLVECKIEQKLDALPTPVVTSLKSIAKDYPGYKVVEKNYYKKQNYTKSKEYYEVIAKNGKSEKRFYYEEDGTLIKIKG